MITELHGIDIRENEALKNYTYTKVGGPADFLAFPRNHYELSRIVTYANKANIPWMVLGNASNLIVRDGGIRGFVIMFDKLNAVRINGYTLEAEAGANLIETTKIAKFHSLTGFEFACGIPGSIGGAVFMNAGAYGGEIAHIFLSAKVLTPSGEVKTSQLEKWPLATVTQSFKKLVILLFLLNSPLIQGITITLVKR